MPRRVDDRCAAGGVDVAARDRAFGHQHAGGILPAAPARLRARRDRHRGVPARAARFRLRRPLAGAAMRSSRRRPLWFGVVARRRRDGLRPPAAAMGIGGGRCRNGGGRLGTHWWSARWTPRSHGSCMASACSTTKDYLFPLDWPLYAWVINLGYLPLIALAVSASGRVPGSSAIANARWFSAHRSADCSLPRRARTPCRRDHARVPAPARARVLDVRFPGDDLRRLGAG